MLLQRMRVALPRFAAGVAIAAPLAYAENSRRNVQCQPEAAPKHRTLVRTVTQEWGSYGPVFHRLLESAERMTLEPGEPIFRRGDKPTHMYMLVSGEAHMMAYEQDSAEEHHVDTLLPGGICGENALLQKNNSRSRTIVAHKKCEFLKVDIPSFEEGLHHTNPHIAVDTTAGGRTLAFINMVCPSTTRVLSKGDYVFKQGEPHDPSNFYILNEGKLDVLKKDKFFRDVVTEELHEGDCFGFVSLLNPDPSAEKQFSVQCKAKAAEIVVINGSDFHRLMDHSKVVRTLMTKLVKERKTHADASLKKAGSISRFRGI